MTADQKYVFELVRTYDSRTTPTIIIDDQVLIGFDPTQLDELLPDS